MIANRLKPRHLGQVVIPQTDLSFLTQHVADKLLDVRMVMSWKSAPLRAAPAKFQVLKKK
jgi:hypothetical protein